jgi:hypothetical protein
VYRGRADNGAADVIGPRSRGDARDEGGPELSGRRTPILLDVFRAAPLQAFLGSPRG